ncbi:hypothetical protein KAE78_07310 [Microbacterium sp. NIBRBAC000506063]|nr:hypothetical protein KAE78_07310 [Microbacterium sp. NIBRBAC000506063]
MIFVVLVLAGLVLALITLPLFVGFLALVSPEFRELFRDLFVSMKDALVARFRR